MSILNAEEQQVLFLIKTDADQARYFFTRAKSLKWFFPLKKLGYFDPKAINYREDGNAIFWDVLDYLERVSEQVIENSEYGKDLIDIIDSVVQFSLNNKKINNYYIWWYCLKITNNLPADIIKDYLKVQQFRKWLDVWTDRSINIDPTILDIGEKLLPKFLQDDYSPDFQYAETIIDVITQTKSEENRRGITNRDNAVLVFDSYWVSDAFNKNAKWIGQKCSLNVLYLLADRLNDALKFKQKYFYANIEIENKLYQIRVARVELKAGGIGFKDEFYKCIVKEYSQEQLKNINRQFDFWALYNIEPAIELKPFDFKATDKAEMVSSIQKKLPSEIEWTKSKDFIKKLENIFYGLYSDYSSIWIKSLAEGGRDHSSDAEEMFATILRDVLLARNETSPQDVRKVLKSFLSEKYQFPIFRRFVLLLVEKFWTDYFDLLDQVMELTPGILEKSDFEVELQDILLNHNSKFSPEFKAKLKSLIEHVPEYYLEKGEALSAYWKFKWLSPLRENSDFQLLYEDAKQTVRPKDDKPYVPERSESQSGFVTHRSPISKEEILKRPVAELLKYISEFKGADFWHGAFEGEPDKEGLAETLRSAVIDEPKKFTDEIIGFLGMDYFYLHSVLRGLEEAWKAGKELDWKMILDFCEKYLEKGDCKILEEASQAQGEDSGKGKYIWIVDEMVDLIREGSKDDGRAFDPEYFDKVEKIFDLVFPLLMGEEQFDPQRDALTYVLNTTLGKTTMAYVFFSLRVASATKQTPQNWGNDKYERFMSKGIEGYIWFGCYLPQMMNYLDQDYTKTKIRYFAEKPVDDFKWRMFMEGYLTGAQVYKNLYLLMRENYIKGLSGKVFEGRVEQRLVEHICMGYLYIGELLEPKNEDGKDSLFWNMLTFADKWGQHDRWIEVVNFFFSYIRQTTRKVKQDKEEHPNSEENKKKILGFWAWTFNNQDIVIENLGDEHASFLGRMVELTILLDRIDEEKEKWLLLSAPHIDRHHDMTVFIEYLTKFDDEESIERIGRIYKEVLEHTTPEFRKENIELIVRKIYDKGNRQDAEDICNTYGRRGVHFLKPVWDEYQKKDI